VCNEVAEGMHPWYEPASYILLLAPSASLSTCPLAPHLLRQSHRPHGTEVCRHGLDQDRYTVRAEGGPVEALLLLAAARAVRPAAAVTASGIRFVLGLLNRCAPRCRLARPCTSAALGASLALQQLATERGEPG
jgi:hypothetical protein